MFVLRGNWQLLLKGKYYSNRATIYPDHKKRTLFLSVETIKQWTKIVCKLVSGVIFLLNSSLLYYWNQILNIENELNEWVRVFVWKDIKERSMFMIKYNSKCWRISSKRWKIHWIINPSIHLKHWDYLLPWEIGIETFDI